MPLWLMKISLPPGVRSIRVRNWSSSPVEYTEPRMPPSVPRIMSLGSFARFSAQLVTIVPEAASFFSMVKPSSSQNCSTVTQISSGVRGTTSQRRSPSRSTR